MKRKHVLKEQTADDFDLPKENQRIVRIVNSRGNNLHEVETADDDKFLVTMPTKFRRNLWIKRGDFVLVESIEEGDKVKAEIVRILSQEHIKIFTSANIWPKKFTKKREHEDDYDDEGLFQNRNRRPNQLNSSEEEDDDTDEMDEDDDNNGDSNNNN